MDVSREPRRVRIGVVDDHPLVARALDGAASRASGTEIRIEVRAVAASVDAAFELLGRDDLDVVVCDLQVGTGADGLLVIDVARRRSMPVLVVSGFDRPVFARAAFERGAAGFVTKGEGVDAIVEAIGRVAAGETAFGERALHAVRAPGAQPTARELDVIRGIAAGRSTDEIARDLALSTRTVESHVRRLFDRFGVVSRAELAVVAEREGWLSLPAR